MGVVNITPDSFSDGGQFLDPGAAIAQAEQLVADGAEIIDIGAESSRPGSRQVSQDEEWGRLLPVLTRLAKGTLKTQISLDTRKPELMMKATDFGISFINDIEGGRDEKVLRFLAARRDVSYICMHMHGDPATMQKSPLAGAAGIPAISRFFNDKTQLLMSCGFSPDRIYLDPGFGFGKTDDLNAKILAHTPAWVAAGRQLVVGVSRKSFFGRTLGLENPADRDAPSKICELSLAIMGAGIIRTHDVKRLKHLLALVE
jgi:dihydropteroate synthase